MLPPNPPMLFVLSTACGCRCARPEARLSLLSYFLHPKHVARAGCELHCASATVSCTSRVRPSPPARCEPSNSDSCALGILRIPNKQRARLFATVWHVSGEDSINSEQASRAISAISPPSAQHNKTTALVPFLRSAAY